jgi:sarcosine oxidase
MVGSQLTPAAPVIRKDIIVVGLGAFGSAALWRLAARGVDVCGIEQHGIGHNQGSSHGATRVFRVACHEHPDLTPVAKRSLQLWTELGQETGETLVSLGGALSTGRPGALQVAGVLEAAEKYSLVVERLDAAEVAACFPAYRNLGSGDIGVLDPLGGICYPERNVRAQTAAAVRLGAQVYSYTRVLDIQLGSGHVTLTTPTATFECAQVIITTGAWLNGMVPGLGLTPVRTPMFWFRARPGFEKQFTRDAFPSFIRASASGFGLWGHGSGEDFGIKIGLSDNQPEAFSKFQATDPDTVDRYIHQAEDIDDLSATVAREFPGVVPQPEKSIVCMVTRSPDTQFLIGRPNDDPRLIVAGGDSGHGFKHAAGIGEILARFAVGEEQESDLSFVSPNRFVTAG